MKNLILTFLFFLTASFAFGQDDSKYLSSLSPYESSFSGKNSVEVSKRLSSYVIETGQRRYLPRGIGQNKKEQVYLIATVDRQNPTNGIIVFVFDKHENFIEKIRVSSAELLKYD